MPSALIYIVFMALLKNVAAAWNGGIYGMRCRRRGSFPPSAQFHTKNVDKIVSKRLDSMLVH